MHTRLTTLTVCPATVSTAPRTGLRSMKKRVAKAAKSIHQILSDHKNRTTFLIAAANWQFKAERPGKNVRECARCKVALLRRAVQNDAADL